jgi:hypothetical protein
MANPAGESNDGALKLDFDRRLMLQFRGSVVTSDAGLLAYRVTTMAGEILADARTGKNGRHALVGLLRQSVFGRLAGYEDVNDAERRAMIRRCVGSSAAKRLRAARLRRARWVASRHSGLRRPGTSLLLPTYPANGLTWCTAEGRRAVSCSTWTRREPNPW